MTHKLAPSILSADFASLGEAIETVTQAGAHYIHFDVMDGHFVPNLSFGVPVLRGIRSRTDLPFDVHLMIDNPLSFIDIFAQAGADILTAHLEACTDIPLFSKRCRMLHKKPAVAVNPSTPVQVVLPVLEWVDMVLIMSVEPGFGGQPMRVETLRKAEALADYLQINSINVDIEMDGGIDLRNVRSVLDAGVTVVVAGSAVFAETSAETAGNVRAFLKRLS